MDFGTETLVSRVHERDRERAFATLVAAFAGDPIERWLYPGAREYLTQFPVFLAAFGGRAFETRTVWELGEFSAVALWLPPGAEPDGEAIVKVLAESVSPLKHADVFAVLDQMAAAHPTYPHWYLPWLGVDPALQGRGIGSRLMEHGLKAVDASHLPAYLESPNPRNVGFYERHGFGVVGRARSGTCPPLTFMFRGAH